MTKQESNASFPYKVKHLEYRVPEWNFAGEHSDEANHIWYVKDTPAIAMVHYFEMEPDLPTLRDLQLYRVSTRDAIRKSNGALIKAEFTKIDGVPATEQIIKVPLQPSGMGYVGAFTIPFKRCSYVLKVQCQEVGVTGMRDSTIFSKLLSEGKLKLEDGPIPNGWARDPYDSSINEGLLMNLSESEEFDDMFPQHPLTIIRSVMKTMQHAVKISDPSEPFDR